MPMNMMRFPPGAGVRGAKRGGAAVTALMARSALQAARQGGKRGGGAGGKTQILRKSANYMKKRDEKRKAYREKMMAWRKLLYSHFFFIPFEPKKTTEKDKKEGEAEKEEKEKEAEKEEEKEDATKGGEEAKEISDEKMEEDGIHLLHMSLHKVWGVPTIWTRVYNFIMHIVNETI